jgi:hypothetical protein
VSDSVVCRPPKLEDVNVDYSKMVAEPTYWWVRLSLYFRYWYNV